MPPVRVVHLLPSLEPVGYVRQLALLAAGLARRPAQFDVQVCVWHSGGEADDWLRVRNGRNITSPSTPRPLRERLGEGARNQEVILRPFLSGVNVHRLDARRRLDMPAWRRLRELLSELQPDVLHCWGDGMNRLGAWLKPHRPGMRLIVSGHGADVPTASWPRALDRWLAGRAECLVVNRQALCGGPWSAAARCEVIAPGVLSPVDPVDRQALRASLNLPDDAVLIASMGKLLRAKRVGDLLWALDVLRIVRPRVRLLVLGDGPQRWRLERFVRQCQFQEYVRFVGWRADTAELIAGCDQLWLASQQQSTSHALLEAMAADVPVVAADTAAHRELVSPGETGLLYPPGKVADLASCAKRLIDDPAQAARLAHNARQLALANYSAEEMVEQYVVLYEQLQKC